MGHYDDCYEDDFSSKRDLELRDAVRSLIKCEEGAQMIQRNMMSLQTLSYSHGQLFKQTFDQLSLHLEYYDLLIEKRSKK